MISKKILSIRYCNEWLLKDKLFKQLIPILYFYNLIDVAPEIKDMVDTFLKESRQKELDNILKVIQDSTFNWVRKENLIQKYLSKLTEKVCKFQFKLDNFRSFSPDDIQTELKLYRQVANTQLYLKVGLTKTNGFPLVLDKQRIDVLTTNESQIFEAHEYTLIGETQFEINSNKYQWLLPNYLLLKSYYNVGTRKVNMHEYWMLKDIFGMHIFNQLFKYLANPKTEITLCYNSGLNALYSADKHSIVAKERKTFDRDEKIFLHGTSLESAKKIIKMGMDDEVTKNKVYGDGIYATKCLNTALRYSSKIDNYSTIIVFKARAKATSDVTEENFKDIKKVKPVNDDFYYVINTTNIKTAPLAIIRIFNSKKVAV